MLEILRGNPTVLGALMCCGGPLFFFMLGTLVGALGGRGYRIRLERR